MLKPSFGSLKLGAALAAAAALAGSAHAEQVFGLTTANQLFNTDTTTLGTVSAPYAITGLAPGSTISSIDFQPATNTLYGLSVNSAGNAGQLYTINPANGVATAASGAIAFTGAASTKYTIDFNPVANALRIVGNGGGNYRVPFATGSAGAIATDTTVAYNSADVNSDPNFSPAVVATAYSRVAGGATTLYAYDFNLSNFATQGSVNGTPTSPNTGQLFSLNPATGSSNLTAASSNVGFDISNTTGTAFASAQTATGGATSLYTVNLATGTATLLGGFGGGLAVADFALSVNPIAVPEPSVCVLVGAGAALVVFAARRRQGARA